MVAAGQQLVLFDAVGTLIYPHPGVVETYQQAGAKHGSCVTEDEVRCRFREGRQRFFGSGPSEGCVATDMTHVGSSDDIEYELWFRLIQFVFDDLQNTDAVMDQLWRHFSKPAHWRVYDDVPACLRRLSESRFGIGVASNFDSRLAGICQALLPQINPLYVFWSSQMRFRKPDERFFRGIAARLGPGIKVTMVGDDLRNDYEAPRRFGWRAYLLDRQTDHSSPTTLASLRELPVRLGVSERPAG